MLTFFTLFSRHYVNMSTNVLSIKAMVFSLGFYITENMLSTSDWPEDGSDCGVAPGEISEAWEGVIT